LTLFAFFTLTAAAATPLRYLKSMPRKSPKALVTLIPKLTNPLAVDFLHKMLVPPVPERNAGVFLTIMKHFCFYQASSS